MSGVHRFVERGAGTGKRPAELLPHCEVELWHQGAFEPGGYTLDSLINKARQCDFAVMVATPDDLRESREQQQAYVPRDNVILEFGLFAGVLGRDRTYLLGRVSLMSGEVRGNVGS